MTEERSSDPLPCEEEGTGLCPEAQADGVPCSELGRNCPTCQRAVQSDLPEETGADYAGV